MTSDRFDNLLHDLATGARRRSVLGALFGAALAALWTDDGSARRRRRPKRRNGRRNRRRNGGRKKNRDRNKTRDKKKRRKNKKGKDGRCKNRYSEKEILRFIKKAARKYGQSRRAMERVARCESGLDPCAVNRSGPYYGLYQFLKSTWKSTPYKNKSIYDPKAQAMATAWMWKQGRKNEWACK